MAQHQKYPASPDRPNFDLSDAEAIEMLGWDAEEPEEDDFPVREWSDEEVTEHFRAIEEGRAVERENARIEAREALAARRGSKVRGVTCAAAHRHRRAPRASGSRRRGSRRSTARSGAPPGDPDPSEPPTRRLSLTFQTASPASSIRGSVERCGTAGIVLPGGPALRRAVWGGCDDKGDRLEGGEKRSCGVEIRHRGRI